MNPRMRSIVAGTIGVIATIFVWWLLVASGTVDDRILPGPFQLVSRAMTLDGGEVALHLGTSLQRVIAGGLVFFGDLENPAQRTRERLEQLENVIVLYAREHGSRQVQGRPAAK